MILLICNLTISMDHSIRPHDLLPHPPCNLSRENMQLLFDTAIKELYFANKAIGDAFHQVKEFISSPLLEAVLRRHHDLHLHHMSRLEKIFDLQHMAAEAKACHSVNAILTQATEYLTLFSNDVRNFEVALILTSRKLAHYKIAAYGAAADLALGLDHAQAATLLAIGVQEEEEYLDRELNALTDQFVTPI